MENNSIVYYGSDLKLALSVDLGDVSPDAVDFEVAFFSGTLKLTLKKSQLIRVEEGKYLACIKYPNTHRGILKAFIKVKFHDDDFEDGIHNIVEPIAVGVKVV